jgi:hypothetical protein
MFTSICHEASVRQSQLELAVGKGNNFLIITECYLTPAALMRFHVVPPYTVQTQGTQDITLTIKIRDAALSDYKSSQLY